MNVNRRCKSEGSLLVIESDEEFTDAQTVKQRIFDELKRIIVPQLNLAHNNSFKCPFCCPELHESDSILYRCPICFQKATKIKKHREIVPYVAKSQPSFSLTDIKSEKLIKQTLAIEDAKRSASNIQEISNTLKQLYKARDLLDPVINEIILSASQLTVREIHEFRKDNYPICYITAKQFKDTSDVINMFLKVVEGLSGKRSSLPTNTTSNSLSYFNEIIVNTLYLVNKDDPYGSPDEQKVYVDKFVLKELIQLHEVLGCTIAVIQDAERKERRKPIDLSPKESESIELTRKLSAASKASLSHKQKTHKESKSKKYRSPKPCSVGASKDRECRGVHVKPVKRPLRAMAEMAKYKECSRGDKKQCKRSETDKECQKKGLFACCNRKKCKKEGRSMQDVNKKKSISFAESKDNVLLEFKIDGRPIQIKMDKNTKEYLVKSLQKSKALNITASDEKSPNAQESSNFINSVMLDRHDYCKKGSPYTVECNCDSDDSVLLTQPSPDSRCTSGKPQYESGGSSRNFETSSLRKAEDTHTQTKNSKTSMGLCKTKNAFGKQNGPCPFVCLNYARDTQTLHLVKTHGSQRYDSDSNSVSSKCNSGVANIYPKSDEESTGIQMFLPSTRNNCIWNSQKRLSDPDSKLFDQSISLFSLPKCNYQPESPPNTRNINDVCCQKENTQLKYNFENDDYRKTHKTSQGTETHCVEYTAFRCIAEKDTELIQSLESCNYSPSEDCSYGSLMRKYTVIHNQTKPGYKSCKGTSETSFKVYTALNAQGTMEQGSINQRGALNVCCKCRKKLQNEEDKGESTKSGEERNDSVAIQTSQHSLKESAVGSSQTEDKGDLQTMQKNASLQPPSEPSACFQKSNSAQTNSDLKQTCYKFPRTCNRGCLKGESRGRIPSVTLPNDSQDNTTDKYTVTQESTLKGSNEDFKSVQNDFNTSPKTYNEAIQGTSNDKCRGCLKGQSRNRNPCNTPQNNFQDNTTDNYTASTQDPKLKEPTEDFKSFQNDLKAGEMHFVCKGNKQCRGRAAQYSYLNPPSFPEGSTNDFENLQEETKYITCKENRLCGGRGVQTGDRIVCPEAAKGTQTLPNQCTSETEKESSFMCSAVQTNDEDQFSRYRKGSRSYQESENRSNNNVEKTDRHSCTVVTLCSSTSIDSKCKSDNAEIQTDEHVNPNSEKEQSETQKESQSNKDADVSSLQIQTGYGTGKKDLMVIKIVVPEAAAAAIEQSLMDEATTTPESSNNLPVAVEIVSSFSTNVKVLRSDADMCSGSRRPSRKSDRSVDKTSLSRHITPVKNLLPPRHMSANRVKVSKATVSRPGIRVNSDSICRCNQLPQIRRYDRLSDPNKKKSNFQGELNDCECKSCSCPSLVKFDDVKGNNIVPSSKVIKDRRASPSKNVGTWRQTVLEAIYRLLFGENCENFKKGQECEIDVEDTTTTVKYSQECQCPSIHAFRTHDKKESVTYRCNLVSPNFGDLSVMRNAIDRDLISQLGDILKVKSSKLSRKGNKLDLSLVLSFQTQTATRFKTKETISCITEPHNNLNIGNAAWGIRADFKTEKGLFKNNKFSRQITSTSFLKNILRKHSCRSILINPLVENSLQNGQKWSISTRESNLGPFSEKPKG